MRYGLAGIVLVLVGYARVAGAEETLLLDPWQSTNGRASDATSEVWPRQGTERAAPSKVASKLQEIVDPWGDDRATRGSGSVAAFPLLGQKALAIAVSSAPTRDSAVDTEPTASSPSDFSEVLDPWASPKVPLAPREVWLR